MRRLRTTMSSPRSGKRHATSFPSSPTSPSQSPVLPPPAPTSRRIELIVKLGGSALTQKGVPHTLHAARFATAMDAMARLHAAGVGHILVHGAGSFGHFEAVAHGVAAGTASPLGMSQTHAAVARLNTLVVDALVARGVPAVGVSPLLVPAKVRVDFVAALLDRGHVPVVHGDACYAGDGRTAVLSGDAVAASLAAAFGFVTRAVFLSDVPGVLDRPPEEVVTACERASARRKGGVLAVEVEEAAAAAALVQRVTVNAEGEVTLPTDVRTSRAAHDATGGIAGKVAAAARCVAQGEGRVTAFIAGVGTEGAECALMGRLPEPWSSLRCTRVTYDVDHKEGLVTEASSASSSAGSRRRSWFSP